MDSIRRLRRRLYEFLWGEFRGAPVVYLMAIAIVYVAMIVTVVNDWI